MKSPESSDPQTPIFHYKEPFPSSNPTPFIGSELTLQTKSPTKTMSHSSLNVSSSRRISRTSIPSQDQLNQLKGYLSKEENSQKSLLNLKESMKQNISFVSNESQSDQIEKEKFNRKLNINNLPIRNSIIKGSYSIRSNKSDKIKDILLKKANANKHLEIPMVVMKNIEVKRVIEVPKQSTEPKKENRNLFIQMVKALYKTSQYQGNIHKILKEFELNDAMIKINNDIIDEGETPDIIMNFKNESTLINQNYNEHKNLIKRRVEDDYQKDYIYFNREIDIKDEAIKNLCFLTIPRIICCNGILQLMSICPIMHRGNTAKYFLYFKNVETFKTLEKLQVSTLTACFQKSINSFGIQFLHQSTLNKVTYCIFTRFPEECKRYVEGFNFLLRNRHK